MVHPKRSALDPTPKAGDPREVAIPRLVDQFGGALYHLGLRFCGSHQDAQDLVQETFLQAYRKWGQFEGRSSPKTWLFSVAARACQRMRRLRAGQPQRVESLDEDSPFGESRVAQVPDVAEGPADRLVRAEMRQRMEVAIGKLPATFRVPFILKDVIDLSVGDVASALGLKPQTVKTRVHRARLKVRRALLQSLPHRPGAPAAYSKRVCLDLLQAKQDALDRGAAFPVRQAVICERCQLVFAELDMGLNLCHELGEGALPARLRRSLLARMRG